MKASGLAVAALLVLIGVICICVSLWTGITTVNYNYNKAVHSHMENAYYSSDPVTMKTELTLAVKGMRDLGLTDDMYSTLFPWNKVPNYQMKWQYTHMDSVLTRVDEWQKWEVAQNTAGTGSQQMQDVNTQKLNNVRFFIRDDGGWSDDIAEGAYVVNFYLGNVLLGWFGVIIVLLGFIFGWIWVAIDV